MSIHIEDLTVRFKNSVTAIDHADLDIPNGIFGLLCIFHLSSASFPEIQST